MPAQRLPRPKRGKGGGLPRSGTSTVSAPLRETNIPAADATERVPPRDLEFLKNVMRTFKLPVNKGAAEEAIRMAVNKERHALNPIVKDLSRDATRKLLEGLIGQGEIMSLPKGAYGSKGELCGLPEIMEAYINENKKSEARKAAGDAIKEDGVVLKTAVDVVPEDAKVETTDTNH